ncbi:hypothetical protein [Actinopolymorpha pittospori]
MSMYGSWIIAHAPGTISTTRAVADLERTIEVDLDLQDWPTGEGWSGAFSRDCLTGVWNANDRDVAVLTGFTQALAIELGGQVAAGWSEDGAMFAGSLSTATTPDIRLAPPLLLGFGLADDRLEAFEWGDPYLARLSRRYGSSDWQTAAAPAIVAWLRQIDPRVAEDDVLEALDDDYGDAAEGLSVLIELAGFTWAENS